ncbi:MAG: hypothetical protein M9963_02140 [Kiritimatiellae bacterium]|nr:hypothetical protein [Kiritimatiellia bacterium]MCO5060794.1 hypothetical protein [Kiritimatiellia bacterium]MCO5068816.1 hypothetical protein [Kiritimatiellia bacterium]MCO6399847.1 hypothetical protein [Verrucomicrobiota bacterium]
MMGRRGNKRIVTGAAAAGTVLSAVVPAAVFEVFELSSWLFGGAVGLIQSLIGLLCYRRAIYVSNTSLGWGLGSGFARILALIVLLALAIEAGLHPEATAISLLIMYFAMMVAEITVVARTSTAGAA